MSTGSGVYHAEREANARGELMQGLQIWINVPRDQKMANPRYGTNPEIPTENLGSSSCTARVLAGDFGGVRGPFETVAPVQMIDVDLTADSDEISLRIDEGLDIAILYVYEGSLRIRNDTDDQIVPEGSVVLLDAKDISRRDVVVRSHATGPVSMMVFAGRKIG